MCFTSNSIISPDRVKGTGRVVLSFKTEKALSIIGYFFNSSRDALLSPRVVDTSTTSWVSKEVHVALAIVGVCVEELGIKTIVMFAKINKIHAMKLVSLRHESR